MIVGVEAFIFGYAFVNNFAIVSTDSDWSGKSFAGNVNGLESHEYLILRKLLFLRGVSLRHIRSPNGIKVSLPHHRKFQIRFLEADGVNCIGGFGSICLRGSFNEPAFV